MYFLAKNKKQLKKEKKKRNLNHHIYNRFSVEYDESITKNICVPFRKEDL